MNQKTILNAKKATADVNLSPDLEISPYTDLTLLGHRRSGKYEQEEANVNDVTIAKNCKFKDLDAGNQTNHAPCVIL